MKALPTVNQKSVYAAAGIMYADVKNDETITDSVTRATLCLKALQIQCSAIIAELKNRQLDQVDKLNNIKTEMRIIEVKNFEDDSINSRVKMIPDNVGENSTEGGTE